VRLEVKKKGRRRVVLGFGRPAAAPPRVGRRRFSAAEGEQQLFVSRPSSFPVFGSC
jgi:hypothetical protein